MNLNRSIRNKLLLIFASALLTVLSGFLLGLIGAIASTNILLPVQESWATYLCMCVAIVCWSATTLKRGLIPGFVIVGIVASGGLILVTFLEQLGFLNFHIQLALLLLVALGIAFSSFCCLSGSLSLAITRACCSKKRYEVLFNLFYGIIAVIAAAISAYNYSFFLYSPNPVAVSLINNFSLLHIKSISVWIGAFFGAGEAVFSTLITRFGTEQRWRSLDFLRVWAIAIASCCGASFYDLDLSEQNFTEAKLANADLRARRLYRTCLRGATGIEKARVDNRYLDLENPKVQRLLTHGSSKDKNFSRLNLQGAYLQDAHMQEFNLTETNLTGADLRDADLRGSILVRAQVTGVDFTSAKLTGICIQDWSVNSQTCFADVECDYIYRELTENGRPTARYPVDRNFEPREFEALFQEVGNVVELVFKEGVNWRALSFTFRKFQLEDEGLGLELKGVEQRGDLWVVKVTHKEGIPRQEVEQRVNAIYDDLKRLISVKEQQFDKLLNIAADQAKALKESSKRPFGSNNSFFILGSTITNLAGSGQIDYDEAANKVRSIVASSNDSSQVKPLAQTLLNQLQGQSIATTEDKQIELIQEVMLTEAKNDLFFKQFLLRQGQQVIDAMPESVIARAIQQAIANLIL